MSDLFEKGLEYEKQGDYENALKFYKQAAEQGDAKAQCNLGDMYWLGMGTTQNPKEAIKWYKLSAELGNPEAQCLLGSMYELGDGVDIDINKAIQLYSASADQGNSEAKCYLGMLYENGVGVEKNLDKAIQLYSASADQGNSSAQCYLGMMYEDGIGVEKNLDEAFRLFQKAADQDDPEGQCLLGNMYMSGESVEENLNKAFQLYQAAAKQEYSLGQWLLGTMYEFGIGMDINFKKAVELYKKSADQENPFAQNSMGNLYASGQGVKKNAKKAVRLWLKAAENELVSEEALYNLGYAYYDGYGVERDLSKAKEYFEKAIEQGYQCSYALNMVKGELDELDDSNKMREYADTLIKKNIPNDKLYQQISKDLQKDFGDTWDITSRETKKFLETGMFTYFSLYSLGPHIYGNLDFSSSITQMFKALEKELGKYLYSKYIEFLKNQNIDPNTFSQKRSFLKRTSANGLSFKDSSDLTEFTLGNLHLTVGLERKPHLAENNTFKYTVDQTMIDYLNSIFKEDAFGEGMREREITDYIISLTQEVKSIADSLRNPAAHDQAMKIHKAEVCGNYIIKVQRLLIDFLEKVK